MIRVADGLELRDGKVRQADGRPARHQHVPERYDIPRDHPLYGMRALEVVLSGMGDMTIDDEGKIVPIDVDTGLPVVSEQAPIVVAR